LLLVLLSATIPDNVMSAGITNAPSGNAYAYLNSSDPFCVNQAFPKLTTSFQLKTIYQFRSLVVLRRQPSA
jgi:hypothetical protein